MTVCYMRKSKVLRISAGFFGFAAFCIWLAWANLQGAYAQPVVSESGVAPAADEPVSFEVWLSEFLGEASQRDFSQEFLAATFSDVKPVPRVIELDRKQPEFTQTFWAYLNSRVSENRMRGGRQRLKDHAALLRVIEKKYGVQGRFLVAFWGLETNFGQFLGGFPVVDSLATLAHDKRRSAFFRAELFHALGVLSDGHIGQDKMIGSWAGAMGQPQFMPSTFAGHAVDENGDGRKDVWTTLPDVFGSAANYLSHLGWDSRYTWGREVLLPDGFDLGLVSLSNKKPLKEWQALGIRRMDKRDLPTAEIDSAVILPAGVNGPAFLVYQNFEAILSWNRSLLYAVSVGHLADRLIGLGPLKSPRHEERALSRDQVFDLQKLLNDLDHDAGEPDGQAGPQTRAAVKSFQKEAGLPPDGYPDGAVFDAILATTKETEATR
jgi:membrane-bound lytic murein transglycosylase B